MGTQENQTIPPGTEVDQTVVSKGKVGFSIKSPAPKKLKAAIAGVNYFCAGIGTLVGASDLFSGYQAKVIMFITGVMVLAGGSLLVMVGVKPATEE